MTAPVADPVATAPAPIDEAALLNDDAAIAAAISGVVERKQHLFPDEPAAPDAATPKADDPAPAQPADPAAVDAKATADSTTPEGTPDGAADPTPAVDHFAELVKAAKPLPYRVNGTERLMDAILELPDGKGALVPPDKVAELRNLVSRYDSNAEAYREFKGKVDAYETRFGGMEKITERLELAAQTDAAALTILTALRENPLQFVQVVDGQVVPNTAAVTMLTREAALNAKDAKWQVRQEWEAGAQTAQRSQADAELRQNAVPSYLASNFKDLHADDRALLEENASSFLFTATREQAAQFGVAEGTLMIDADRLAKNANHLKTLRSQVTTTKVETTAAVKAAEKAAVENAKRNPAPKAVPPKAAAQPRDPKTGEFREKRLDAAEIFERSLRGESIGTPQLTE